MAELNLNTLKDDPQPLVDYLADVADENALVRKLQKDNIHLNLATAVIALNNHIKSNGEENMDEFSLDNPDSLANKEKDKEWEQTKAKIAADNKNNKVTTEARGTLEQQTKQKETLRETNQGNKDNSGGFNFSSNKDAVEDNEKRKESNKTGTNVGTSVEETASRESVGTGDASA